MFINIYHTNKTNDNEKTILALAASTLLIGAIITSCNTPDQKMENAQNAAEEANQDLNTANQEYLADVENYRKETAEKVAANEKSIAEFKARVEKDKKLATVNYKKEIAELEQKNTDLKKKMDDYKAQGKDNWQSFKDEFNTDMNKLGKAIKDFVTKDKK